VTTAEQTETAEARTVDVHTPGGGTDGTVELPAALFDVVPNIPLMHQVVVAQLAAARQGTASAKTRGEVSGGGRKPYRQKGTGRARQGSTRAPQFTGGGVSHGPQPRDYAQRTPKKMKAAALRCALSDRARDGLVHVISALTETDTPATKSARTVLAALTANTAKADTAKVGTKPVKLLVVLDRADEIGWLSVRNLPSVHPVAVDQVNTYDVLVNDAVVFTRAAYDVFLATAGRAAETLAEAVERRRAAHAHMDGHARTEGQAAK
jgi:large subunit ribosomal protein L4